LGFPLWLHYHDFARHPSRLIQQPSLFRRIPVDPLFPMLLRKTEADVFAFWNLGNQENAGDAICFELEPAGRDCLKLGAIEPDALQVGE
jgi:hypothetical protein